MPRVIETNKILKKLKWALPKLCKNICIRGQSMVASNMYCGVLEASVGPKFFVDRTSVSQSM